MTGRKAKAQGDEASVREERHLPSWLQGTCWEVLAMCACWKIQFWVG